MARRGRLLLPLGTLDDFQAQTFERRPERPVWALNDLCEPLPWPNPRRRHASRGRPRGPGPCRPAPISLVRLDAQRPWREFDPSRESVRRGSAPRRDCRSGMHGMMYPARCRVELPWNARSADVHNWKVMVVDRPFLQLRPAVYNTGFRWPSDQRTRRLSHVGQSRRFGLSGPDGYSPSPPAMLELRARDRRWTGVNSGW